MSPRRSLAVLAGVVALALTGCGAPPPQAPLPEAMKLDASTSGISNACGESYQVTKFDAGDRRDLETLEATAEHEARKLASVMAKNANWIYQGQTVREITHEAIVMLQACGLTQAGAALTKEIGTG